MADENDPERPEDKVPATPPPDGVEEPQAQPPAEPPADLAAGPGDQRPDEPLAAEETHPLDELAHTDDLGGGHAAEAVGDQPGQEETPTQSAAAGPGGESPLEYVEASEEEEGSGPTEEPAIPDLTGADDEAWEFDVARAEEDLPVLDQTQSEGEGEEDWTPEAPTPIDEPPAPAIHMAAEAPGPEAAPPRDDAERADLPHNYFRAAGDPDEPPDGGPSLLHRLRDRVVATLLDAKVFVEPRWVAFIGGARAAGLAIWRAVVGVRRPRTLREAAVWSGWVAAGSVAFIVGFFFFVTWGMPSTDDLWEARQGQSITFLDRNGHVILREGAQNAPPVDLASLPPYVAQAFIAIEDRRFYDHFGVDVGGVMRAGAENLRAGRVVQGGSTITQQLAKNLFLTNERSWRRKAQELAMAIWLEGRFTKDEILALYLSRVYFGAGAYGVEAAAERYFDRPARELTLLQSAMLAGLVKAPSRLNPARQDIAAARARAQVVLDEMVAMSFISAAEREAALQEELVVSRRNPAGVLSYYRDWIDPLLNDVIGQQRDDFIVETTIDIAAQRAAAEAVESVLAEQGEQRRVEQAAVVALDDLGGVRAMVGGRDYDVSQFNRATQARRQPGSAFKFFIYLTAMENGLTPWSIRDDAPITVHIAGQPDWSPGNYTGEYHGPVTLTTAFAHSFNMVAIRVANEIGGGKVIDVARRLGVRSPLHNYHSLALGAQEITLLEMTQAYGAMASEGYNVEAHGVSRIRRANNDETMWSWRSERRERVVDERSLRYMNQMMQRVVDAGTGTRARIEGRQIGGKTGTGNDYRDAWFIGFTPGLVAGVWVGNDNFSETARVTGGSLPAEIWARLMPTALRNTPARELQLPRPEDYDPGLPDPSAPELTVVGAPIGAAIGTPAMAPPDDEDRSLDFGPEG